MDYTLENLKVYQLAEEYSDEVWNIVVVWENFRKDTLGKQLVRSSDSISTKKASSFIFMHVVPYKNLNRG